MIADIVEAAWGIPAPVFGRPAANLQTLVPADGKAAVCPWYLRFEVLDAPGVLALGAVATAAAALEPLPELTGVAVGLLATGAATEAGTANGF